jgi:DDE superfamily endonuclease/Winged helix-turn helix
MLNDGPSAAGYPGACWRTPMMQQLRYEAFGVLSAVHDRRQLLKNMGFAYHKARWVSAHQDPERRHAWLPYPWCEVMHVAQAKDAYSRWGDEASCPQGGTLTDTWAKRGPQPTVPTSGIRQGANVLGVVDYFAGRWFAQGHERRVTAESYAPFLEAVLKQTPQPIMLSQDGARSHTSKALQEFFAKHASRLTVYHRPSDAPDYTPREKLWNKIKQVGTPLPYVPTFEALVTQVHERLPMFEHAPEAVLSLFGFSRDLDNALNKVA